MFEISQGKRVRREDLHSRSFSPESSTPDVALETFLHERFEQTYKPAEEDQQPPHEASAVECTIEEPNNREEAFDFRLFSTSTPNPSATAQPPSRPQKITIKSLSPDRGESGFTQPRRPDRYYFTGASAPARRQQYESIAVSGQDVLHNQLIPYPGHTLPWRVLTIKLTTKTRVAKFSGPTHDASPTRKRKGKKRRIAIRKKLALQTAQQRARAADQAEKELAERQKRTRRNREKKVKKKEREKAKKAQGQGEGEGEGA